MKVLAGSRGSRSGPARVKEFDRAVAEFFMRLALEEARKGVGRTSPNPTVGALLVKGGRVVARGFHAKAGGPHAEVVAIEAAGERAKGADLYTTLEPCDHHGRTPPCTRAILAAGVKRVFVGSRDPNPLVSGRGIRRLRRAGIPVESGVLDGECDEINRPFFRFITARRPFVTLKVASSADGKIAAPSGDSRWVTGEEARRYVHRLRSQVDAVLVGAGTVRKDDPRLSARVAGGRNPVRVVLDSRLRLPLRAKVFAKRWGGPAWVATTLPKDSVKARALERRGVSVLHCRARKGRVDLEDLLRRLAKLGIVHLLVEGGAEVFGGFVERGLADRVLLFVAPKVVGRGGIDWAGMAASRKLSQAWPLKFSSVLSLGEDVLLQGEMRRERQG